MSNSNLPSQYALFWPLLHVAEDDAWHDNNQVFKWVFDYLKIPEAARKLRYEKSGDLIKNVRQTRYFSSEKDRTK